jgi:hypothetical protein
MVFGFICVFLLHGGLFKGSSGLRQSRVGPTHKGAGAKRDIERNGIQWGTETTTIAVFVAAGTMFTATRDPTEISAMVKLPAA